MRLCNLDIIINLFCSLSFQFPTNFTMPLAKLRIPAKRNKRAWRRTNKAKAFKEANKAAGKQQPGRGNPEPPVGGRQAGPQPYEEEGVKGTGKTGTKPTVWEEKTLLAANKQAGQTVSSTLISHINHPLSIKNNHFVSFQSDWTVVKSKKAARAEEREIQRKVAAFEATLRGKPDICSDKEFPHLPEGKNPTTSSEEVSSNNL